MNYKKRCDFKPNWVESIIAGYKNGEKTLSKIDFHGLHIKSKYALTGMAAYFCNPVIVNNWNENMSEGEARKVLEKCFEVLFYRVCTGCDK